MTPSDSGQHARELRELEPHIIRRQLRALEQVAQRLTEQRPEPDAAFLAGLERRIDELPEDAGYVRSSRQATPSTWRLATAVYLALGLGLLVVAALMIAAGTPGGH